MIMKLDKKMLIVSALCGIVMAVIGFIMMYFFDELWLGAPLFILGMIFLIFGGQGIVIKMEVEFRQHP
ncbi:MAG: hypothetical protein PWQ88_885 [Candidatus Methanomethylophilaceae archaeon]|nr:hypothetical protein [Candidatus Methanomethylophilaceae archaeon]MDI3541987.1 hypothetical protein [Candidatus Methanomethylophilaceae archaeon]